MLAERAFVEFARDATGSSSPDPRREVVPFPQAANVVFPFENVASAPMLSTGLVLDTNSFGWAGLRTAIAVPAPPKRRELLVRVIADDDGYTALEDQTGMYGIGDSIDEAVADLFASLRELRADLEAHADRLSQPLAEDLALLRLAMPG